MKAHPHTIACANRGSQQRATFELCAETLEACAAANEGGADRIELCANLHLDGTTPPDSLVAAAVASSRIPVHVLIRPQADDFRYDAATFRRMREQIVSARQLGAAGVVAGVLKADDTVAVAAMQELVELAAPLPLEFHRAFDRTPDLATAFEDVVRSGCARLLTSGGAATVIDGAPVLAKLVQQAGERIEIAAGGGLRVSNAAQLAAAWKGRHYHGSLGGAADGTARLTDRVRDVLRAVQQLV